MFVDGCMVFHKANRLPTRQVKTILENYCKVFSGHPVNFHKYMFQFIKETENRQEVGYFGYLQVPLSDNFGTYLGYRNINFKRIQRNFLKIQEKISNKVTG